MVVDNSRKGSGAKVRQTVPGIDVLLRMDAGSLIIGPLPAGDASVLAQGLLSTLQLGRALLRSSPIRPRQQHPGGAADTDAAGQQNVRRGRRPN